MLDHSKKGFWLEGPNTSFPHLGYVILCFNNLVVALAKNLRCKINLY